MAEPWKKIPGDLLASTNAVISDAGGTDEDAAWIRKGRNATCVIEFIREQRRAAEAQAAPAVDREQRAAPPYWTYPAGWSMAEDMRIGKLKEYFPKLDFSHVEELAARYSVADGGEHVGGYRDAAVGNGRKLVMPEGMGGLAIIPKLESLARLVKNPPKGWKPVNLAMRHLLGVLKEVHGKGFHDWTEGLVGPEFHQLYAMTEGALAQDAGSTPGGVHVLAVQTGQLFAGYSVDDVRVHVTERPRHYGLHCVGGGALMLAYPERFVEGALWMDCPGSERAPLGGRQFSSAPFWCFSDGQRSFHSGWTGRRNPYYGSGSFVLPE